MRRETSETRFAKSATRREFGGSKVITATGNLKPRGAVGIASTINGVPNMEFLLGFFVLRYIFVSLVDAEDRERRAIEDLQNELELELWCAKVSSDSARPTQSAAELEAQWEAACAPHRAAAKANAAEKARLNDAANKTTVIDSLASCNTTSILLVGGGLFAIFCIILFTIAAQRSI